MDLNEFRSLANWFLHECSMSNDCNRYLCSFTVQPLMHSFVRIFRWSACPRENIGYLRKPASSHGHQNNLTLEDRIKLDSVEDLKLMANGSLCWTLLMYRVPTYSWLLSAQKKIKAMGLREFRNYLGSIFF